ncbi:hypothetical protein C2869_04590 [Saccharobesus litoralis]|uniref:Uncharacterized protein n=1 Tax=Saccharobesus litoralis TaxID=2172099 RepID=A0A2S0VNF9_9ALTE|nr:hypothetical protein [Saccharobesus litoralis]AWB65758.1 hypothetical protein C2869_04590 [Saccharobesus litoralis]
MYLDLITPSITQQEIPQDCRFIGYGIMNNNQYLLEFDPDLGMIQQAWANAPLLACSFKAYEQATVIKNKISPKAQLCRIYENKLNRYILLS